MLAREPEYDRAMKWEYKTLNLDIQGGWRGIPKVDPSKIDTALGDLGQEGWELVSALDTNAGSGASHQLVAIFKRPHSAG